MIDRRVQLTLFWSALIVPALCALAFWLLLWTQLHLPAEDDFGLGRSIAFLWIASGVLALITARTGWTRTTTVCCLIATLLISQALLMWALMFLVIVPAILLAAGYYHLARRALRNRLARHDDPAWRLPLAIGLLPSLVVLGASLPLNDEYKLAWPWSAFRPQIAAFTANADAAADRLGLPYNRALTPSEVEAWQHAAPLVLRLDYPILHGEIVVRINATRRTDNRYVFLNWPGPERLTFGPMDLHSMHILHASD